MVAFLLLPANTNTNGIQTKLDRVSSEQIGLDAYAIHSPLPAQVGYRLSEQHSTGQGGVRW
jgi:hypothetical protein